jgi:hypothetical protein
MMYVLVSSDSINSWFMFPLHLDLSICDFNTDTGLVKGF